MKLETIRKRVAQAELGKVIGPFEISIDEIRQDPTFQVRKRLDVENLNRLKAAYRSEKVMLPITLAILEETPHLLPVIVDGHHRVTVLETMAAEATVRGYPARTSVEAMFLRVSANEARWQAASANSGHGAPLKGPEVRSMFRRYVEAGHHRTADGGLKSYREIGREIGKTHPTIKTWMKADFPKEAAQMSNEEMPANVGGEGAPAPIVLRKHGARAALGEFMAVHAKAGYHERQEMIDWLWSALEDMERVQERTDVFGDNDPSRSLASDQDF